MIDAKTIPLVVALLMLVLSMCVDGEKRTHFLLLALFNIGAAQVLA